MSRKLKVNIEVIDPIVGNNFGFKVSNGGQYLTFTQSGLPDSIGWDKTYVGSGGTTSVVQVNRFLQLDSDLNIMATQSYGGVTNGSIACVLPPSSIFPSNSVAFVGNFTQWTRDNINIITSNRIMRVQPTSYTNYGSGFDFYAGRIIEDNTGVANYIAGSFNNYKGYATNNFVKTNLVGEISTTFRDNMMSNPDASKRGFNSQVKAVAVQIDGKVICGGWFTNFNGYARNRIVRLNLLGQLDSTFIVGTGFDSYVNDFAIQSDNKIICVGAFTKYFTTTTTKNRIVRLSHLGTIDAGFVTTGLFGGTGDVIECVKLQSDGKILVGGFFNNNIARLLTGGSIDPSFNVGTGFAYSLGNARVFTIEVLTTGKIVVGGTFDSYNGNPCGHIVMLNSDGTFYKSLTLNYGIPDFGAGVVRSIKRDSANNLYVGGNFTNYLVSTAYAATGDLYSIPISDNIDIDFGTGFNTTSGTRINKMSIQKNHLNDLVAVGNFSTYKMTLSNKIVKFKYDGSLVTAVGSGSSYSIGNPITEKFVMKSDGSMVVFADKYEGVMPITFPTALKNDMTVDTSFVSQGFTGNPTITDIAVLPDDSFILVGTDLAYGTASAGPNEYITGVKISATGSLLHTYKLFIDDTYYDYRFKTVDVCPLTNRIAFGGRFNSEMVGFDGEYRINLVVTDINGDINITNPTFGSLAQPSGSVLDCDVNKLKWDNDGRLLVIGTFSGYYNGTSSIVVNNMVRLNADGSLDPQVTSNVTTAFNGITNDIKFINKFNTTLGINEIKTIIYGEFTSFNGVNTPHILRLNSDGSLDTTFNTGPGLNAAVDSLVDIDDNLICVGEFTTFNGVTIPSNRILMLNDSGLITATVSGLYETVQKTYDNLSEFNMAPGVTYSIVNNIVRMEYTFDDDEIVDQDIFDVPDHVELSYTNESISINEKINEIVTRSDHKIQTQETGTFSGTNFKIRIYEGSLFSGVTASPVKYNITKPKIVSTQTNVYIDVSNLIKEDFEWNIGYFYSNDITIAADLPENISKWVYIEENNYLGTASVSLEKHYLYAIDGYLLNNEIQHLPNLLVNGSKRYVHRDQQQRIYFQTNFLTGIQVIPEVGFSYTPSFDVNTSLNNTSYVQSLSIDKPVGARYIDYIFTYTYNVETVRYYFYGEFGNCGKEYQELIFKNKWGVLESLAVAKKSKTNLNSIGENYTRSIVDYNGNYDVTRHTNRKFDVDMEESFILNTDVLPEYMTDSIIDLYASDEVWLKNDNGYTPVVVDGSVNDLKRRIDGPISYNIKVNASHRKIKNIL